MTVQCGSCVWTCISYLMSVAAFVVSQATSNWTSIENVYTTKKYYIFGAKEIHKWKMTCGIHKCCWDEAACYYYGSVGSFFKDQGDKSWDEILSEISHAEICFYICYALLSLSVICYVLYLIKKKRLAEVGAGFLLLICGSIQVVGIVLYTRENQRNKITKYGYSLYVAWVSVGLQFLTAVALLWEKDRPSPPGYSESCQPQAVYKEGDQVVFSEFKESNS